MNQIVQSGNYYCSSVWGVSVDENKIQQSKDYHDSYLWTTLSIFSIFSLSLSLSIYIYIYIYICVCGGVHLNTFIYIYVYAKICFAKRLGGFNVCENASTTFIKAKRYFNLFFACMYVYVCVYVVRLCLMLT